MVIIMCFFLFLVVINKPDFYYLIKFTPIRRGCYLPTNKICQQILPTNILDYIPISSSCYFFPKTSSTVFWMFSISFCTVVMTKRLYNLVT